jgi:hypothetical protein
MASDVVKVWQPSDKSKEHLLIEIDGMLVVWNYMQVHTPATRYTGGIFYHLLYKGRS